MEWNSLNNFERRPPKDHFYEACGNLSSDLGDVILRKLLMDDGHPMIT